MSSLNSLTMLRMVGEKLATVEKLGPPKGEDFSWHWEDGVVAFPEVLCPFCFEAVQSASVWKYSSNQYALTGQVRPVNGRKLVLATPDHPSSTTSGAVCWGSAKSLTQALFLGLNPGDHVYPIKPWLETDCGHTCPRVKLANSPCPSCARNLNACQNCLREGTCHHCGARVPKSKDGAGLRLADLERKSEPTTEPVIEDDPKEERARKATEWVTVTS